MRSGSSVEVPVGGAGWMVRNAGRVQRRVEGTVVEDVGGVGSSRHRLLRLERWAGAQNADAGGMEGHGPSLHHALPWVVAHGPRRGLVLGALTLFRVWPPPPPLLLPRPRRRSDRLLERPLPPPLLLPERLLLDRGAEGAEEPYLAPEEAWRLELVEPPLWSPCTAVRA